MPDFRSLTLKQLRALASTVQTMLNATPGRFTAESPNSEPMRKPKFSISAAVRAAMMASRSPNGRGWMIGIVHAQHWACENLAVNQNGADQAPGGPPDAAPLIVCWQRDGTPDGQ